MPEPTTSTVCPDCEGQRVYLVGDPGDMDGYREEDCDTCKGAGEMDALAAALLLLGRMREYDKQVLAVKQALKELRGQSGENFERLIEVCAQLGMSVYTFERSHPPAPALVPEF